MRFESGLGCTQRREVGGGEERERAGALDVSRGDPGADAAHVPRRDRFDVEREHRVAHVDALEPRTAQHPVHEANGAVAHAPDARRVDLDRGVAARVDRFDGDEREGDAVDARGREGSRRVELRSQPQGRGGDE